MEGTGSSRTGALQPPGSQRTLERIGARAEVAVMRVRVEVICIHAAGAEQRHQVLSIERAELAMETLGMSLDEGKALLTAVQDIVVSHQVQGYLERRHACLHCRARHISKYS